jgi:hypothetical protein
MVSRTKRIGLLLLNIGTGWHDALDRRALALPVEEGLQNEDGGRGIDALLLLALLASQSECTHGAFGHDRGESLVRQEHVALRASGQTGGEIADFGSPWGIGALEGKRKSDDDSIHVVALDELEQRTERRALAAAPQDVRQRLSES